MVTAAVQVEIISPSCAGPDKALHLHMLRFWPESGYLCKSESTTCCLSPSLARKKKKKKLLHRSLCLGPPASSLPIALSCSHLAGDGQQKRVDFLSPSSGRQSAGVGTWRSESCPPAAVCSGPSKAWQLAKPGSQGCRGGGSSGPRVTLRAYRALSVICRPLGPQPATPFENPYCV